MAVGIAGRRIWPAIPAIMAAAALALLAMGRPPICLCGHVRLFAGDPLGPENSQQLADWYSASHLIHGLIFYAALHWLLPRAPLAWRAIAATCVEAGWELIENSPWIIDRYRAATVAAGYSGDSVLNSMSDISFMLLGFWLARRLPVAASIALAAGLELLTLWLIRDNLTLNVVMLLWPIESVRHWQAALPHR